MKTIFKILVFFAALTMSAQLPIALTSTPYVDSRTSGQYPNATIDYVGEYIDTEEKTIEFKFYLKAQDGKKINETTWTVAGSTEVGNTIKNEGMIQLADTSQIDFISFLQGGGDLYDPTITVLTYPELSFDDVANYFVLGGKLDKIQLPVNANARKLVKWLLEETLIINGELLKTQFQFN